MQIGFLFSLIFAILVTVFAIQNADSVLINFLFAKVEVSQALVIFISVAIGGLIVMILGISTQLKLKMRLRKQDKNIKELKATNEDLLNQLNDLEQVPNPMIGIEDEKEEKVPSTDPVEETTVVEDTEDEI